MSMRPNISHVSGIAEGRLIALDEGLSFWGGVDPKTATIIDIHHPQYGTCLRDAIVMMPTSRGSCSGSGVLLELALQGLAPAALIFHEAEEILSLGALFADLLFDKNIAIIRLSEDDYNALRTHDLAYITKTKITADDLTISLSDMTGETLSLTEEDHSFLEGTHGRAAQIAFQIICRMAEIQGADRLISVTKGHIDGSILAHDANLIFAETMQDMGAKTRIPTSINAISVDREQWLSQNIPSDFGNKASRLADAYVKMGARAVFTCAPYLLGDAPAFGEVIGWSESNAVIYANSILGARTTKHPDYLDLCIAMTGRAPASGVYQDEGRRPQLVLALSPALSQSVRQHEEDVFWPLLGWLAGKHAPHSIPLIKGCETLRPTAYQLKALCAGFGTSSASPLLHIAGHTPEAELPPHPNAPHITIDEAQLSDAYQHLTGGKYQEATAACDVIAIGSPHASFEEILTFYDHLCEQQKQHAATKTMTLHASMRCIITTGRHTIKILKQVGIYDVLCDAGIQIYPDICWCSITAPLLPQATTAILTNSSKYAHYAYGLCGKPARLASLADCARAAISGNVPTALPSFITAQ